MLAVLRLYAYEYFNDTFYNDFSGNTSTLAALWWKDSKQQHTDEQWAKWLLDIDDDWHQRAIGLGCMTEEDRLALLQAFGPKRGPKAKRTSQAVQKLKAVVECWIAHDRENIDLSGLAYVAADGLSPDMLWEYVSAEGWEEDLVDEVGADKVAQYIKEHLGLDLEAEHSSFAINAIRHC